MNFLTFSKVIKLAHPSLNLAKEVNLWYCHSLSTLNEPTFLDLHGYHNYESFWNLNMFSSSAYSELLPHNFSIMLSRQCSTFGFYLFFKIVEFWRVYFIEHELKILCLMIPTKKHKCIYETVTAWAPQMSPLYAGSA